MPAPPIRATPRLSYTPVSSSPPTYAHQVLGCLEQVAARQLRVSPSCPVSFVVAQCSEKTLPRSSRMWTEVADSTFAMHFQTITFPEIRDNCGYRTTSAPRGS